MFVWLPYVILLLIVIARLMSMRIRRLYVLIGDYAGSTCVMCFSTKDDAYAVKNSFGRCGESWRVFEVVPGSVTVPIGAVGCMFGSVIPTGEREKGNDREG